MTSRNRCPDTLEKILPDADCDFILFDYIKVEQYEIIYLSIYLSSYTQAIIYDHFLR